MNPSTSKRFSPVSSESPSRYWPNPKKQKQSLDSESGLSLWLRLITRPSLAELEPLLFPCGPKPGDVIEITGIPGSGKSLLVLHMIATTLLPKTWKGARLGGCDGGVVFVDTDIHFNILQLENMLYKRLIVILNKCKTILKRKVDLTGWENLIENQDELKEFFLSSKQHLKEELKLLTKQCLNNFLYLKCTDRTKFALTLLSINEYLMDNHKVSMVVVDSISAFYWTDHGYQGGMWYKTKLYYNKIFKVFLEHLKTHKIVLVSTCQSLFQKNASNQLSRQTGELMEDWGKFDFMGPVWANSVTCRILLSITSCPVLRIGSETMRKNASGQLVKSSISIVMNELDDSVEGNSKAERKQKESSEERTTYCAEIDTKDRKAKIAFTIHEEGIRWHK